MLKTIYIKCVLTMFQTIYQMWLEYVPDNISMWLE